MLDESNLVLWPQFMISEILQSIANGESVERACDKPGFPSRKTFFRWLGTDADLAARYAEAVRQQIRSRYIKAGSKS